MDTKQIKLPDGWFSEQNIATYRTLISSLPYGSLLVELGCYKGKSICSAADIIVSNKIKVVLVDNFSGADKEVGVYGYASDLYLQLRKNLSDFKIDLVKIHKMNTHEAAAFYCEGDIDMLFIDADHSYQAVKQDIEDWLPKIKENGIIAGHDFFREGVQKAVMEQLKEVEHQETIWFKKNEHNNINKDISTSSSI